MTPGKTAHERGMKVRREVLGDEHVDAAIERTMDFTADFQDLITRYAWGEIWTRPGLDRRIRSCITLTALVALGKLEELEMHVRAALRNGLTQDEIKEVLLQSARSSLPECIDLVSCVCHSGVRLDSTADDSPVWRLGLLGHLS
jgi:4-carboxymuconolactone decarboxylase